MMHLLLCTLLFLVTNFSFAQPDSLRLPPERTKSNTKKGVYDKVFLSARFPGGDSAYRYFFLTNLRVIIDSAEIKGIKKREYRVLLTFAINEEGRAIAISAECTPKESFLEKACMNMVDLFPLWEMTLVDGKIIKEYRKQPLTFEIE